MPQRLTATEKWRDSWFRRLKPVQKCFWLWMLDQCDAAGTVDIDLELASVEIGAKITSLAGFEGRLIHVKDNRYWIRGFIEFQQKCGIEQLNPANKAQLGIIRIVEKYGLSALSGRGLEGATKGLPSPPSISIGKGTGTDIGHVQPPPAFTVPTLTEIEAFMEGQMPAVAKRCPGITKLVFPKQEAPLFLTYWDQRDWLIKGKKMKDWHKTAYNWLINGYKFRQEKAAR